jgi:serine-type D-Ala-D-Ala carboxypeptidase/endopeptidase (penicillin-binding protein 4)
MMKKFFTLIVVFHFLATSTFVQAQDPKEEAQKKKLNQVIDSLVKRSRIKPERLGIVVGFTGDAEDAIYNLNGKKKMIPASVTKVITAATALEKLPIGYKFTTALVSDGLVAGETLKGNLYLKGGGDASFVSESMWFLVNNFTRTQITQIEGDIVVDDSYFDSVRFDPGRDPARNDEPYDAPIGAMSFNWSAVSIFARPNPEVGQPPKVFLDPDTSYLRVVNRAKTVKGNRSSLAFSRRPSSDKNFIEEIHVTGEIGKDSAEVNDYRGITQPDLWSGYNLKEFLKQRGIAVTGKIRVGKAPATSKTLADVKSKPVADQVRDMMKYSNNFVAETLTKNLSVHASGAPGTMPGGIEITKKYLRDIGVTDFELTSPSGLSRRNLFFPNDIFKVLSHVKQDFRIYPEYLASFPVSGIDGTLKKKRDDSPSHARVRAKTGHLTGVAGLAGFLGRTDEQQVTFVFLYNGEFAESARARDLFDQILDRLAQ